MKFHELSIGEWFILSNENNKAVYEKVAAKGGNNAERILGSARQKILILPDEEVTRIEGY